jgi:adenylate cyclase class IV
MLGPFKAIMEKTRNLESFQFTSGPDYFFRNPKLPLTFVRFRRSDNPDQYGKHYQQLTSKTKSKKSGNNIKRKEPNLHVEDSQEEVFEFIKSIGFEFSHSIKKRCHIYTYTDATLAFYSVQPENSELMEYFIEIEVNEATIDNLTETEAMQVIEKYEKLLSTIDGVSAKKRLKLSLNERYGK